VIKKLENAIGATQTRKLTDICADCQRYEKKIADGQLGYANQALCSALAKSDLLKSSLQKELAKWNKQSVEIAQSDYRTFTGKKDTLKQKKQAAQNDISLFTAYLSAYTKEEIAQAGNSVATECTELDTASEEELTYLSELLEQAKQRKSELEISIAGRKASLSDIDVLDTRIEVEQARLDDLNLKLSAITLAQTKLDEAEINIRRTVSPYLGEHSSKLFSLITDGDYSALKLDCEMNLSYIESGDEALISSTYFSAGSADLAWLCLRLALHKRLSENVRIPIILDEALVYFDDMRLKRILSLLDQISKSGTQVILLSASEREYSVLGDSAKCLRLNAKR
jgi:uncharacterized protein YhaN